MPLPASLAEGSRATKAITALLAEALVEERETSVVSDVHRTDGDLSFGLYVTPAGLAAIGVEGSGDDQAGAGDTAPPLSASAPAGPRQSKTSAVLALLARDEGATLPELIDATGWLPHTTRAALTGLRKKGHSIARSKREGITCYRIAGVA
nr:DUF3489 domain-containing protein [Sphingomonas aerophila]